MPGTERLVVGHLGWPLGAYDGRSRPLPGHVQVHLLAARCPLLENSPSTSPNSAASLSLGLSPEWLLPRIPPHPGQSPVVEVVGFSLQFRQAEKVGHIEDVVNAHGGWEGESICCFSHLCFHLEWAQATIC